MIHIPREPKPQFPAEPFELIALDFNSTVPPPGFTAATLLVAILSQTSLDEITGFREGTFTTDELARLVESRFADKLKDFHRIRPLWQTGISEPGFQRRYRQCAEFARSTHHVENSARAWHENHE